MRATYKRANSTSLKDAKTQRRPTFLLELKSRDNIPLFLGGKKQFQTGLDGIYTSPMQVTDWPLVEVALLLIGLTHASFTKPVLTLLEEINSLLDYKL
jgi:hypothetical protein